MAAIVTLWIALTACGPTKSSLGRPGSATAGAASTAETAPRPKTTAAQTIEAYMTAAARHPTMTPKPTPTATATTPPDLIGYQLAPNGISATYVALEALLAGPLLADVEAAFTRTDAATLVAMLWSPQPESSPVLSLVEADQPTHECLMTDSDVSAWLASLWANGSTPLVQGYFAANFTENQSLYPILDDAWNGDPNAHFDRLDVVVAGWRGPFSPQCLARLAPSARPAATPSTAVWRFERIAAPRNNGWRWTEWRWHDEEEYGDAVRAAARVDGGSGAHYFVVRPRRLWPTPLLTPGPALVAPASGWTARNINSDNVLIDPRDEQSHQWYNAVELTGPGDSSRRPIELWQNAGVGYELTGVFGWLASGRDVVIEQQFVGDGCGGGWSSARTRWIYNVDRDARRVIPDVGYPASLDPTRRWLAGLFSASDNVGAVRIVDLNALDASYDVVSETLGARDTPSSQPVSISQPFVAEHVAGLVWAPDSTSLVFTIVDDYETCAEFRRSHLVRFDRASQRLTDLTAPDATFRRVSRWNSDGTLDVDTFVEGAIWYDRPPDGHEQRDAVTGSVIAP